MARFLRNPLNWLRKNKEDAASSSTSSGGPGSSSKRERSRKHRKSGKVFMQLISLQKRLQELELALRQKIDFTELLQEIIEQVSLLKAEAEAAKEEELAGIIGQVSAYFDTVSEGRLALKADGLAIIRDFVFIFKDAIGAAAPGVSPPDTQQLKAWNARYQTLMAQMEPIYEDVTQPLVKKDHMEVSEEPREEAPAYGDAEPEASDKEEDEEDSVDKRKGVLYITDFPEGELEAAPEIGNQKESFVAFRSEEDIAGQTDEGDVIDADEIEEMPEPVTVEVSADDEIPLYDPSEDMANRDVTISDEEIKSVREYIERDEARPEIIVPEEVPEEWKPAHAEIVRREPRPAAKPGEYLRAPVHPDEIEELKKQIIELTQKQEELKAQMSGMMGNIKAAMEDSAEEDVAPVEDLDADDLEDIIFIGRKKG
jgi:hypothetical protein